jgi:hypothetical protein
MGSALPGPDSSIQRDNLNIQHGLQRGGHVTSLFLAFKTHFLDHGTHF